MESPRPHLIVIIPTRNEAERIKPTLRDIHAYLSTQSYTAQVVVVANGCTDGTEEVVRAFQKEMPELVLDVPEECPGKGCAVQGGMLRHDGDYFLFMDADNATPLSEIGAFWPALQEGFQVVIGSRHVRGSEITVQQPWYRQVLGRSANFLIRLVLLPGIRDTQAGFKLFTREAAKNIFPLQTIDRWGFDMEILALAKLLGYRIKEVPIVWHDVGASRLRPAKAALGTLSELFLIRWRLMTGYYRRPPTRV